MKWFRRRIYLDCASAPPTLPEAILAMREAERLIGNPGAIHQEAVAAKKSLESSRALIAHKLGSKARELIFTSGQTEATNHAILGYARQLAILKRLKRSHWIASSIEHDSVLSCFSEVERLGGYVSFVDPNEKGIIEPEAIRRAMRPETALISIGWANNEVGTVQPLARIAQSIRLHEEEHDTRVVFHADAGQAPLYLPTVVHSLGVDLLSLGANKLYGPHGVGVLYRGKDVKLSPILFGGAQERGLRPGTEAVALAAGFAAAFSAIARERDAEAKRVRALRDTLARDLEEQIPGLVANGDLSRALPHMLNVSIPRIQSEYVTLALDRAGIAVSTKSACREGEESRSHVVQALSSESWRAENTIRFSLGRDTSASDLRAVVSALATIVKGLSEHRIKNPRQIRGSPWDFL